MKKTAIEVKALREIAEKVNEATASLLMKEIEKLDLPETEKFFMFNEDFHEIFIHLLGRALFIFSDSIVNGDQHEEEILTDAFTGIRRCFYHYKKDNANLKGRQDH
jgi:hypothetical protein